MEASKRERTTTMRYIPPDTRYIGVRVPQETYDALVDIQKNHDHEMTLSSVIRSILRQYLRKTSRRNGRKR
jgi:hypothetical protein